MLERLGHQAAAVQVLQRNKPAVRLDENRKQAVQDFGQHFAQRDRLAQVLPDLQHRLQFRLGVDRKPQRRAAAGDVHLGHDRGAGAHLLVVDQHRRFDGLVVHLDGDHAVGRAVVEDELDVADLHLIVFREQLASLQEATVEERPVAAVQILDVVLLLDADDPRVLSAYRPDLQHDVALRVPTEDGRLIVQGKQLARIQAFQRAQHSHGQAYPTIGGQTFAIKPPPLGPDGRPTIPIRFRAETRSILVGPARARQPPTPPHVCLAESAEPTSRLALALPQVLPLAPNRRNLL